MTSDPLARTPQSYIDAVAAQSLAPLWGRLKGLVPQEPRPQAEAALWPFAAVRPFVLQAADIVTAKEAERRVLILENPSLKGSSRILDPLFGGLQLVMPGEIAPAHRHSQSALRFVIDGRGAFTSVGGERTPMHPGDFIVTPPWRWHDHGNDTDEPMIWLDGLDIPMVRLFSAGFEQDYETDAQPVDRPVGDSLARYGSGLLPVDHAWTEVSSPVFNYPYEKSRAALFQAARGAAADPCHGHRMRYTNPIDGGWAMPTIATYLRLLPEGFATMPYRSTESAVFVAVEGQGVAQIGERTFEWAAKDIFAVPAWTRFTLRSAGGSVLFTYSDRAAQDKLGFFREQRGNEAPTFPAP